jgi:hypothetical protein
LVERAEHLRALSLLAKLDRALLRDARCFFGGGTAVSLRCGEFRLSRDVDFLCSSRDGYRLLRQRVFERGADGLFTTQVEVVREIRVDRYGIRMAVAVDGEAVKLELVSEGRIDLDGVVDTDLPVERLSDADLVAEKLLANADRFLDDASMGRDAIDLLLLEHALGVLPAEAWEKARLAYGPSVECAWTRALLRLRDRPEKLARFFDAMSILPKARALVQARLGSLPAHGEES